MQDTNPAFKMYRYNTDKIFCSYRICQAAIESYYCEVL